MPGTAAGTQLFSRRMVFSATSATGDCLALFLPDITMFGFRIMPSSATRWTRNSWNVLLRTRWVTSITPIDIVIAIHQDFGLDDRNYLGGLAQRRIARERVRVDMDRGHARNILADVDHRAPFRKARALFVIIRKARGQLVETDSDEFTGTIRQRLGSLVDLDTGNAARLFDQFNQRRPIPGLLPDGLVIEDDAGDVFRHRLLGAKQHLAIVAAGVLGRFDLDRVKPLLDGAGGFVGG